MMDSRREPSSSRRAALREQKGEKKGPDSLVFSTTLALRYAIGLGSSRAVDIDLTGSAPPVRAVSVTYHEIIPYIGSGVLF